MKQTMIVVRAIKNFSTYADIVKFVVMCNKYSIKDVILGVKQDDDNESSSGKVFYKSVIAPSARGYSEFDVLQSMITECKKVGIRVYAWIPQFHDQVAFRKSPSWEMKAKINGEIVPYIGSDNMEYFVNPFYPEVQNYEMSIIKEVANYEGLEGIFLDWIRFDNYNMDLSDYTRIEYQKTHLYDPAEIDFNASSERRDEWQEWRTTKLAEYFKKVYEAVKLMKPILQVGVFIVPPMFEECGQDAFKFRDYVDVVSPMAYFKDWGYNVSWVYKECIPQTILKVGNKLIPCLGSDWSSREYKRIYTNLPTMTKYAYFTYGLWTSTKLKAITAV